MSLVGFTRNLRFMPLDAVPHNAGNDSMIYTAVMLATATSQFWDTVGNFRYCSFRLEEHVYLIT
jgi:hypothetical protein